MGEPQARRGARVGVHFAILTDTIHRGTFGVSIKQHKHVKRLPERANLRDHSDELELALTGIGEATSLLRHRERDSQGYSELLDDAEEAGKMGKIARLAAEQAIGRSAINPQNFLSTDDGNPKQPSLPEQEQPTLFDDGSPKA